MVDTQSWRHTGQMKIVPKSLAGAALVFSACTMAAPAAAPVNVLNKGADFRSDLKTCQAFVAEHFVPASVAEARSTTAVCEVIENSITCRDVRPSASSLIDAPGSRKSTASDDRQDRQSMLAHCLGDKGWRDR
jgi:hypothetical protein